jgi:phospholipase C
VKLQTLLVLCVAALFCAAACARRPQTSAGGDLAFTPSGAAKKAARQMRLRQIQHVVIIVQENRSFDNLFATFPGADGATTGLTHTGEIVPLKKASLEDPDDIAHQWRTFTTEYDGGKMDGFDLIHFGSGNGPPAGLFPYQYVDPAKIQPYWTLAQQYVLADHMFERQSSGSFVGHQDLIAAGTPIGPGASLVNTPNNMPWGCDAPSVTKTSLLTKRSFRPNKGPFPCFDYPTIADELDAKGITWRYYAPRFSFRNGGWLWSAFDAIRAVRYGSDWHANVVTPQTKIFADAAAGKLPNVAWVVPDKHDSDHPGSGSHYGPSWVARVVDAIGESPAWSSTAIVVIWDDWGGFYDHEPPPQLDYQGLGFRVPMLVISPYVPHGYISHTQYEFASVLRFIEDNWGLAQMGRSDARAASIGDVFDLGRPARAFVPIPAEFSRTFFLHQQPSLQPVDTE